MPLQYSLVEALDASGDHFRVIDLGSAPDWLQVLAREYVQLRTACASPLTEISLDGIEVLDASGLRARLKKATIPHRRPGSNFDVVRSDFGETLSYVLLEQEYGTHIAYKGVRDRETIQWAGRGIDALGIEDGDSLTLVLGETKVSDEPKSPPQVVDRNDDSLRKQHLGHLMNRQETANKIWDIARRIFDPSLRSLFFRAALSLENGAANRLRIVSFCTLVRPRVACTNADFGSFRDRPGDFRPAQIRFWLVRVPDDIESTIQNWYQSITQTEAPT